MSWYGETGYTWKRRASISIDNTAGGAGTIDAEGTIPATLDQFWDEIDSSGNELRVVDADGVTKLAYSIASFNKTNRTGTISIDGYSAPGGGMLHCHLYWNASGAGSGAVATVIASPKTLYIEACGPASADLARALPARPGDTRPRNVMAKGSDETRDMWIDLGALVPRRAAPSRLHYECDEIDWMTYTVTTGGAAQAAMIEATATRFFAGRFARLRLKAGTDGTDYTVQPVVRTVEGLVLGPRTWLKLRDQDEA
jgi:hypothetical protein